ncbi:serine--glyoxylate aminotransferase [Candidatus Pelagibacter sp. HTCC7211]|jgi:alanine-glyoxylate transaminase/serine-glyoxylate transaminase/serine-pyruvate transaminase|uniref:pyridoxal-phosphate-dependent aminotransferase family protein n=1 Tax=Pelagibacter sp. (strain HTCC7211) TaxID=439493 RepID=UPI0001839AC7|nr:aminotransferase class V-fold PLP-dependent enzyme [Candidatus Pelagibacter sp. HTCC7211]EDZ61119.1 serine--glyoxylate aminotransferase [Candidatus Pelagibacter sp. HTCC7211]|tara:strand:- start:154 stop:1326 length:1173 start_codon:yes stop_codon:yes gene_type:complete
MAISNTIRPGRHFLQIPGPTNVPDRVLRAMDYPTIDHRGPDFAELGLRVLDRIKLIFKTSEPVIIFPASGTGAWEAAMVNTLSAGDKILMFETGHFSTLWYDIAHKFKLEIDFVKGDWRTGVDPNIVESKLKEDTEKKIKAVCAVHNETSTGVTSRIGEIRKAMDNADHPALLFVDTISSLGSIDYRHEEWKVDVTVGGSQKGLLLPPGLSFNAISSKALDAYKNSDLPKSYWDWEPMIENNKKGYFPYTPATNLLYGLDEAINILTEEGLENVFNRHKRFAEATRIAVNAWGLEILCKNPDEYSSSLTAVLVPEGHDADSLRKIILDDFNMSLGTGLAKVAGKVFRIGHLGDFNELMLAGTLSGVEMGLMKSKIPFNKGGILKALEFLC